MLKFVYKTGHTKLNQEEVNFLALTLNVNIKSINSHVKKIANLKWIRLNNKTQYYSIVSFDNIRKTHQFISRASMEVYYYDVFRINAHLGAALYTYLHKDFWRKVKNRKSVQIKGCTYHFPTSSFNYKLHDAPISIYGVSQVFNISTTKASRLKKQAKNNHFIKVYKKLETIERVDKNILQLDKYYQLPRNLVFRNNKCVLQGIDHILPNFSIRKRKKL